MASDLLFEVPFRFEGLPHDGFAAFSIRDRNERRHAIIEAFHGPLRLLGEDLVERLGHEPPAGPLHVHLPRLDWPAGYQPFCTWLALSHRAHGYQADPQLNVGIHADHVSARLAWDTASAGFGRFTFLGRFAGVGAELRDVARRAGLTFRVYGAAPWPRGSVCVFATRDDLDAAFKETSHRGNWFEVGTRFDLPQAMSTVTGPELAREALRVFRSLLPVYRRLSG
jgi:hypothetical protein